MSGFGNGDITEQYLNKLYEDLHREQLSLMNAIKTSNRADDGGDKHKDRDVTRQITLINALMMNTLRLRNVRKLSQAKL